jgi:tetratricopeptide (TPR) repeat protein
MLAPQQDLADVRSGWCVMVKWMVLLLGMAAASARAHEHGASTPSEAELGAVTFEASCKPQVAGDINRGVALLHSFWHEEARRTFERVTATDPDCAMGWWGQALGLFHLYSDTPTDQELAAALKALATAEHAKETSARETAYVRALHPLFDGYKSRENYVYAQRFADAMKGVADRYPKDIDAKAFYGLALLAAMPPGDATRENAKKAVALMYPAFREHPNHPGLAHYIIHACDHPEMAQQGLEAARRYASIAPAAPHALHMPSHIFARLGLWEDDIRSNLASKAAAEVTTGPRIGAENRLHAMEFLEYAYLQSGRFDEAGAIVEEARTIRKEDSDYADYYDSVESRFPMLLAIETRDWAMAARLEPLPGVHWFGEALTWVARAVAAGHLRDANAGKAAASAFDALMVKASSPKLPPGSSAANARDEIYAWAAFAQGDAQRAIQLLRATADLQAKVGKGEVELPVREMLAEILLLEGRSAEALQEYELSLRSDPNRFNALLGAAQAAEKLGRPQVATRYYRQLGATAPQATGAARDLLRAPAIPPPSARSRTGDR